MLFWLFAEPLFVKFTELWLIHSSHTWPEVVEMIKPALISHECPAAPLIETVSAIYLHNSGVKSLSQASTGVTEINIDMLPFPNFCSSSVKAKYYGLVMDHKFFF